MTTAGYSLRQNAMRVEDGMLVCDNRWSLIRVDNRYRDEVLVEGLTEAEAMAMYSRKLEEVVMTRTSSGNIPADMSDDGASVARNARRRPRRLALKL